MGWIPRACPGDLREMPPVYKRKVLLCVPSVFSTACGVHCKFPTSSEIQCVNCIFSSPGCLLSSTASAMVPALSERSGDVFTKKVSEGDLVRMSVLTRGPKNLVVLIQSHSRVSAWSLGMERPVMMPFRLRHSDSAGHRGLVSCSPPSDINHYTECS